MTAFQALKKPLLAAREIVFAAVSVYASSTMASSGYHYIKNHIDSSERRDFPSLTKITIGLEAIRAAMSIVVYAGLSKLTLQPGAKLYPILSQRPPLPIHQTIAVASMAFVLGPITCVFFPLVSAPLIELCHSVAEDVSGSKKGIKDRSSSSDVAAASVEQVPPTRDHKPSPVSVGTKWGPLMEANVPGSMTIFYPVAEEIFFRGQLFSRLVPNIGCISAALTSSVLFGVSHRGYEGVYFPIAETMLGLACSLLYFRTGRLLVPVALHSGSNVFFVAWSAFLSYPVTLANKYFYAMEGAALPDVKPPELSFWERRIAKNWNSIKDCFVELSSTFNVKAASDDASFLPLDLWPGTAEVASKESIFYDQRHNGLLKAPSLCNADGTPSNFAILFMDHIVHHLFGAEDSIAVERLLQYSLLEKKLQVVLHVLATRPAHAESSGLLHLTMNSSPLELARLKTRDLLVDEGHLEYFNRDCLQEIGIILLEFPLEKVTRSEYTNWYKKGIDDCLKMGLYAELNRDFFTFYCLLEADRRGDSSSIPELLCAYCDLAAAIQKQPPGWYNEWVEEMNKERTLNRGNGP